MKSYDEILSEVIGFISQKLGMSASDIVHTSDVSDLVDDSIQLFELLVAFEKQYQIKAAYADVVNLNTVDDIVSYIGTTKYHLSEKA